MSGYYQMARGWMENSFFASEPYTEREAFQWMIEQAAWRPARIKIKGSMLTLDRGQLCFAQRFLAEKWQWSKSRVDRFLKRLTSENMISTCSKIGATAGHPAGQGQSVITICNYEKYQSPQTLERGNDGNESGATAGQQRGKEEEGKEGEEERKEEGGGADAPRGGYEFSGSTIRLRGNDLARWKATYHAIPDIPAELMALDAWFEKQPDAKKKGWFHVASGALNRKHQELLAARVRENEGPRVPL